MRYILLRLKRFCGFVTGIVFFIGGILKLMDPVGAGLVMGEYFNFLHIGFLSFAAKPAGALAALAETVIGTALITGVWRRTTAIAAMAMQAFFTLLTLLLVIFNPEMDCGCFGEAIHLTHMQTFLKNIALCALLAAYFFPQKMLGQNTKSKFVSFSIVTVSAIAFGIYSWMYIPMVDYTDFKPGALLSSAGAEGGDSYESVFVYEKDGKTEKFQLDNLPDSTWTFVTAETTATAGHESLTLSFYNAEGEYMDQLAGEGKVMVISVYKPEIRGRKWNETAGFISEASKAGYTVLLLVASTEEKMQEILSGIPEDKAILIKEHLYYCDYKTLLTMNRSNGGVTCFYDGYLIRKWASRARPDAEKLAEVANEDKTEIIISHNTKGSLGFQGFLLYVFAVMLLL